MQLSQPLSNSTIQQTSFSDKSNKTTAYVATEETSRIYHRRYRAPLNPTRLTKCKQRVLINA